MEGTRIREDAPGKKGAFQYALSSRNYWRMRRILSGVLGTRSMRFERKRLRSIPDRIS
jgi:1-acyl-sn-glycerol-3-phosphate acyltransferase